MSVHPRPSRQPRGARDRRPPVAAEPADRPDLKPLLLNRELSWIEFNRRVLEEALDPVHPLLERLKFLSIFSTNLDEFFMIRVSGLIQQVDAGVSALSQDGLSAAAQLKAVSETLRPLVARQMTCLLEEIFPALAGHGIQVVPYAELAEGERAGLEAAFEQRIFPVLTPLAVDPSHPFPYISNLSLSLAVELSVWNEKEELEETRFARVKVPPVVPRLLPLAPGERRYVLLEEVIAAHIDRLFPEVKVRACHPFRVTRDADIEIEEDEARDLLREIEHQLRRRRFGSAVRLEIGAGMPPEMRRFLTQALELEEIDVYPVAGPLALQDFMALYQLDLPPLKDSPFRAGVPAVLDSDESIFDILRRQDVLLHHPYESFGPVVDFVGAAAADPQVLAIKQTLYRTSGDSPVVNALIQASERGKQVAVLVELKARFDEEKNIVWARKMEEAGVHVVYGLVGLKTHCKIALVVRQEAGGLKRYVHLGTGNYNPTTARVYTDYGLLTADPDFGADATDLFNYLTGLSRQKHYRKLIVSPLGLRRWILAMVRREMDHAAAGRPARIVAKMNALTDPPVIHALAVASRHGVPADLLVRGICCLRPGVPGLTEGISVSSVVGRFLEHSRVFYFENGGEPEVYLSSADWMERNLDSRVELCFPVTDPRLKARLTNELLQVMRQDACRARDLGPDGVYRRRLPAPGTPGVDSQRLFLDLATDFRP
jgi:polyphosphate kinase